VKKPLSFDHARMQDRVTEDGNLELHSWDWLQQHSAIEAQLAHCFFKKNDRDSGLLRSASKGRLKRVQGATQDV